MRTVVFLLVAGLIVTFITGVTAVSSGSGSGSGLGSGDGIRKHNFYTWCMAFDESQY